MGGAPVAVLPSVRPVDCERGRSNSHGAILVPLAG